VADLALTLACVPTDRTRPLIVGRVRIPGMRFEFIAGEAEDIFRRALREQAFDVTEMSMASHITVTGRGAAAYVAVPVFLSRCFRHSAIYVRTDRGIGRPEDLKGKRIGIPEFQQTAIVWVRGILRDLYGVGVRDVVWCTGGVNAPGLSERVALTLPEGIRVESIGPQQTLSGLLQEGELDAVIATRVPSCLGRPGVPVARLFPDYQAAESDYYERTGFFPIMHCLAVSCRIADAHPQLPAALFEGFAKARAIALEELAKINVLHVSLPWAATALANARALMGESYWSYGFAANRDELATMTRYAQEDGLTLGRVEPERLFHPSSLELTSS
jgi:4,5-dihydroxyphthalate decarboxylase